MKKICLQVLFILATSAIFAQSPIFEITAPANIAGSINFGASVSQAQGTTASPAWGYDLKNFSDFVAGDVAIATDTTVKDSTQMLECCNAVSSNVKGKYALIRRGTCVTSAKAYLAQKAGAIGVIAYIVETAAQSTFTIAAGDSNATKVTIPTVDITYADAQKMIKAIKAGTKVSVSYRYLSMFSPSSQLHYATPLKEQQPYNLSIRVSKTLKSSTDDGTQAVLTAKVTAPDKSQKTFSFNTNQIYLSASLKDSIRYMLSDTFSPRQQGKYFVAFSNNKNNDIITDSFVNTNYTFAQDRLTAGDGVGTAVTAAAFQQSNFVLNVGHLFYTGISADKATHAIFALANASKLPAGDAFAIQLFEMPSAVLNRIGDQTNPLDITDLTALTTAKYVLTGKEKVDSLLTLEFKTPVTLNDTSTYLLLVEYDGSTSATGVSPAYSAAGNSQGGAYVLRDIVYAYNSGVKKNYFYGGGWGGTANIVRLEMAGFKPGAIDTKTLEAWAENQVTVFPNPVKDVLTLNFDLQTLNTTVDVLIINSLGVEMQTAQLKNVQTGTQTINVGGLANGLYFARLLGSDGWRTKSFVVSK